MYLLLFSHGALCLGPCRGSAHCSAVQLYRRWHAAAAQIFILCDHCDLSIISVILRQSQFVQQQFHCQMCQPFPALSSCVNALHRYIHWWFYGSNGQFTRKENDMIQFCVSYQLATFVNRKLIKLISMVKPIHPSLGN